MELETEYAKAFRRYLRDGLEAGLERGTHPDGGYLAPSSLEDRISHDLAQGLTLRRLAAVETITTDALIVQGPVEKRTIHTHELYAQPKATTSLVDDLSFDVESWLAEKAGDVFSRIEGHAFVSGPGSDQPHGILPYANRGQIEVLTSGSNGEVTAYAVMNLVGSLGDPYRKRAWFVMNRSTVQSVRMLQHPATAAYLWQPGLSAGAPDTLAGVPVQMVNDMPSATPGALAVAIGDFQAGYQVVDTPGVRVVRDPFTEKPFVKFYVAKKVGGDVVNRDAIKVMRLAA